MKAIVVEGPNRFTYADRPVGDPAPHEAVVRVDAAGVCGTDLEILDGSMPYFTSGLASYPVVPGHEWTGTVAQVGDAVTNVTVGDRVVGECSVGCTTCRRCLSGSYHQCDARAETGVLNQDGGFAEAVRMPARSLYQVAKSLPVHAAALIEPTAVAVYGVKRAAVTPHDYVAVFGDGPIGLLLLQCARAFGAASVVVVGGDRKRLDLAKALGADATVHAFEDDVPAALKSHGGGQLPNVILEASGNPAAINTALATAAPGARIVLQGLFGGKPVDGLCLDPVVTRELSLLGALGSPNLWPDTIRLVESGKVDPAALVTHELPLGDYGEAINLVKTRTATKVLLRPDL